MLLSAGSTILSYYVTRDKVDTWNGGSMDWFLLGFAVITPMSMSIGFAFKRREEALLDIARYKSYVYQIYLSQCLWDWKKNGVNIRSNKEYMDWTRHGDQVLRILLKCTDELFHFLTLPTMSRARHRVTERGKIEASETVIAAYLLFHSLYTSKMIHLSKCTEELKKLGFPPNEASRIRQWERQMGETIEHLRMLKMYRTPQALRSFGRIFSLLLPSFYAPAFAQLAHDTDSLSLGLSFAIIVSLALTAIFNSILILEDPFVGQITLDGIDVREELVVLNWHQLLTARKEIFPDAPEFVYQLSSCKATNSIPPISENELCHFPSRETSYASLFSIAKRSLSESTKENEKV